MLKYIQTRQPEENEMFRAHFIQQKENQIGQSGAIPIGIASETFVKLSQAATSEKARKSTRIIGTALGRLVC